MRDGTKISACHPNPYARRFLHFMREFVIINQKSAKHRTTSFQESFIYETASEEKQRKESEKKSKWGKEPPYEKVVVSWILINY